MQKFTILENGKEIAKSAIYFIQEKPLFADNTKIYRLFHTIQTDDIFDENADYTIVFESGKIVKPSIKTAQKLCWTEFFK